MWFMYRRLLFAVPICLEITTAFQIMCTALMSLTVMAYLIQVQPMAYKHHNWLALYNEAVVYCGCLLMIIFTDYVLEPE